LGRKTNGRYWASLGIAVVVAVATACGSEATDR
jgi:hypothetical protein